MKPARLTLLCVAIVSNAALLASYLVTGVRASDFGNFPRPLWGYALLTASIAYVANLAFVGVAVADPKLSAEDAYIIAACVFLYYALQVFFIPLVRASTQHAKSRWMARSMLIACVIPMAVVAGIGVRMGRVAGALAIIPAAHVLINDAILYGFLF
tara:strand:- start:389 stop:856 length:468 start_codon:yes stop_codon:yes gene_type:complete